MWNQLTNEFYFKVSIIRRLSYINLNLINRVHPIDLVSVVNCVLTRARRSHEIVHCLEGAKRVRGGRDTAEGIYKQIWRPPRTSMRPVFSSWHASIKDLCAKHMQEGSKLFQSSISIDSLTWQFAESLKIHPKFCFNTYGRHYCYNSYYYSCCHWWGGHIAKRTLADE